MDRATFYRKSAKILSEEIGRGDVCDLSPRITAAYTSGDSAALERLEGDFAEGGRGTGTRVVFLLDTLPRRGKEEIRQFLGTLARYEAHVVAVVPLRYSDTVLDNGTNEYQTVEPAAWWLETSSSILGQCFELTPFSQADVVFTNFEVPPKAKTRLSRLLVKLKIQRELDRIKTRIMWAVSLLWKPTRKRHLLSELKGKSVSVVGNARSLGATALGNRIDENDLVLRFNRAPIIRRKSHGFRTDWLATGAPLDLRFIRDRGVQRVMWTSPLRRKIPWQLLSLASLYIHPRQEVSALAKRARVVQPTTGLIVIDFLAASGCSKVDLFGFDFYSSESFSGHQTLEDTPHDYVREEKFVKDLIARDKRFRICSYQPSS